MTGPRRVTAGVRIWMICVFNLGGQDGGWLSTLIAEMGRVATKGNAETARFIALLAATGAAGDRRNRR